MRDAELILRFLAFHFGGETFRSGFTRHLDNYLDQGRTFDPLTIEAHREAFVGTMRKAFGVFGEEAFRRVDAEGTPENQINSAIFDAIMLTFARIDAGVLQNRRGDVREAFRAVCSDADFIDAISRATRDTSRLNTRLARWAAALNERGIAAPTISFGKPVDAGAIPDAAG
jgi:hypothetical protein